MVALDFIRRWLARRRGMVMVHVTYQGGGGAYLGPMDPFVAEARLAHRFTADLMWSKHRVVSARIVR